MVVSGTRSWSRGWQRPRWLLAGLALSLVLFLFAISQHNPGPPPIELPTPRGQNVALGLPDPTAAQMHLDEFLQVRLPAAPDDRFGTVIGQSDDRPVLQVANGTAEPPLLRAVSSGSVVVTVLLEPRCPAEGICREYRRNLGAVRVTVLP